MVQVRKLHPLHTKDLITFDAWIQSIPLDFSIEEEEVLALAFNLAVETLVSHKDALQENPYAWSPEYNPFHVGLEMANILADLHLDADTLAAAVLYRLVREERLSLEKVEHVLGKNIAALLENVLNMAHIHLVSDVDNSAFGETEVQSEAIRKMLVAMLDDVRVVLLKLAERCCALRLSKDQEERRVKLALEIVQVYIPLAHRLGIGQLKWELEDFAFRYLEPDSYKQIANQLSEKRLDRQQYIESVISTLEDKLEEENISGEVTGRVKHIFSIWKKMQRKNIGFNEVYDIRAIRILVPEVKDCYSVLGLVHTLWGNIPKEFDDYIAQPKENGYRSLHTAVVGPDEKVLEIQIRTFQMHEEAELGVCAHWRYKGMDTGVNADSYEEKLNWFRQSVEVYASESDDALQVFADELKADVETDRIYVFTPKGHVIELRQGATPLDFAYRIHTEIGHGCRGAKVNGRIVPLSYELVTGEKVEVIVEKGGEPNSEWLRSDLNYLNTTRAKLKVRAWFRQRDRADSLQTGKQILEKEFKRLSIQGIDYKKLAAQLSFASTEDLAVAVGLGDVGMQQVLHKAQEMLNIITPIQQEELLPEIVEQTERLPEANVSVKGVGSLLTSIAACCKPVPGDDIRGYITQGRGVSIHRQDCQQLLHLETREPERILNLDWGTQQAKEKQSFPVDVYIQAYDRTGLISDISNLLANENINVLAMNTITDAQSMVNMQLTIEVNSIQRLSFILSRFNRLNNVIQASRAKV